ncbi:hypothetical protein GGD55_004471 [Rhizobium giardinii]|uniref:Uncharacterized protein n=1 Tax=Rhizobium giardinii TaxID=56731 RepID=A0A7W8UE96_9HYPH|nr:hypothetical protein [Rhizobium giardinii]
MVDPERARRSPRGDFGRSLRSTINSSVLVRTPEEFFGARRTKTARGKRTVTLFKKSDAERQLEMSWTRLLLSERVVRRVDTRTFGPSQPQRPQDFGFPAPCDLAFFDDGLCLLLALVKKPVCRPAPWSPLLRHCCHCGHSFRLVVASRHRRSRFARNGSTNPNIASAKRASIKFHKAAGELVRFFTRDPLSRPN